MKLQDALFAKIREAMANPKQLPKALQEVLSISSDGAYRRLRGETALSIDEAFKLGHYFQVSLSDLESIRNDYVVFAKRPFTTSIARFERFLRTSLEHLKSLVADPGHQMIFLAKEVPPFYLYQFKQLGSFKLFTMLRGMQDAEKGTDLSLQSSFVPPHLLEMAAELAHYYQRINAIELWNDATLNSTLSQLEFYHEAGLLQNKAEALEMCEQLHEMLKLIYKQVTVGHRLGDKDTPTRVPYKLYYSEILPLDNSILSLVKARWVYNMPYAMANYLTTTNPEFTQGMREYLQRHIQKSSSVTEVSEKERNQFFARLRTRVDEVQVRIQNSNPFAL